MPGTKIAVVDYGMGNLHSVLKALQHEKIPAMLTDKAGDIKKCGGIILVGVGAFGDGMREIKKRKLFGVINNEVDLGKPILGVCLGMQLLFSKSFEFGVHNGFGFIKGRVVRFRHKLKVPHMGWNSADIINKKTRLLAGIKSGTYFYFVHSYYTMPLDKKAALTKTKYGDIIFTSAVEYKNIFGVQFHPEKSGESALKIYKNFYKVVKKYKN
jgi:glutamine amidotransferase